MIDKRHKQSKGEQIMTLNGKTRQTKMWECTRNGTWKRYRDQMQPPNVKEHPKLPPKELNLPKVIVVTCTKLRMD